MEIGLYLIPSKKSRFPANRASKVTYYRYKRNNSFTLLIICISETAAPCSTIFSTRTSEHIKEYYSDNIFTTISNFKCNSLFTWKRNTIELLEIKTIQLVGNIENNLSYILHLKIGSNKRLVQIELIVHGLYKIISPVPSLQINL